MITEENIRKAFSKFGSIDIEYHKDIQSYEVKVTYRNEYYPMNVVDIHYYFHINDELTTFHGIPIDDAFLHLRDFNQLSFMEDYCHITGDHEFTIEEFKLSGSSHWIKNAPIPTEFEIKINYDGKELVVHDLTSLISVTQGLDEFFDFAKWVSIHRSYLDRYIKYYLISHLRYQTESDRALDKYFVTGLSIDGHGIYEE